MSKPETPCPLPDKDGVIGCQKSDNPEVRKWLYHRPDCPDAPKAEAPPAPNPDAPFVIVQRSSDPITGEMIYVDKPAPPAPVSERPIDFDAAERWAKACLGHDDNAARACLALKTERGRLANDLADALDLKNGVGPTVLTALASERDALKAQNAELAVLVDSANIERVTLKAQNAALSADVERLRKQNHESTAKANATLGKLESEVTRFRNERKAAIDRLGKNYSVDPQSRIVTGGFSINQREEVAAILAQNATLTAELERLRAAADRVVKHRNKHYRDVRETVDALESVLARSLRAAREAGKS